MCWWQHHCSSLCGPLGSFKDIFRRFLSMTAKMNFDFDWILWFLIQNYVSAQNSFYHINNINFMMLHYYVIINSNWSKCVYISLPMVKNHLFHYPRTIKLVNLNKIKFIKIKLPQLSFLFTLSNRFIYRFTSYSVRVMWHDSCLHQNEV